MPSPNSRRNSWLSHSNTRSRRVSRRMWRRLLGARYHEALILKLNNVDILPTNWWHRRMRKRQLDKRKERLEILMSIISGWLIDSLTDWFIYWLTDWLISDRQRSERRPWRTLGWRSSRRRKRRKSLWNVERKKRRHRWSWIELLLSLCRLRYWECLLERTRWKKHVVYFSRFIIMTILERIEWRTMCSSTFIELFCLKNICTTYFRIG